MGSCRPDPSSLFIHPVPPPDQPENAGLSAIRPLPGAGHADWGNEEAINAAALFARGLEPETDTPTARWTPPSADEVARLLPRYRIVACLGRGGMGAVYQAFQPELERPVAIKLLPAALAEEPGFVGRFRMEARTLARLDHPGIIRIHDFGQTEEGHLYFVMEFVDGTDLRHRLQAGPLSPAETLGLARQVCDALRCAHRQGIIHRDIKPANILVTRDGLAKLADFGLARPLENEANRLTLTQVVMGTPDYMAPERRTGADDHRADSKTPHLTPCAWHLMP